ncbi:hypothetical protein MKX08_000154 [Trichoderma sp. CBMAI-0020]|nr:hypothetical protein MKX08_000154 [Trichoderma sp. CBMAI-0020]
MSDTTVHSSPVLDSTRRGDMEKMVSSDTTPEGLMMTRQLNAPRAGRTPLPTSRLKRRLDEVESSESGKYTDSSTLKKVGDSAKRAGGSHDEDDKEDKTISRSVKKRKLSNAKTTRKKWSEEEIRVVITMRGDGNSWEQIQERFPDRTIVGIRQVYWKYKARYPSP